MVEYARKNASSGVAKAALATGITGAALGLFGGGGLPVFGAPRGAYGPGAVALEGGGYVTEKEMNLIRENSGQASEIARLQAEKYADAQIELKTAPMTNRICALETAAAVNAARDHDYRRYVEREFVHQPKASIRESIVTCQQRGCCCACGTGAVIDETP